jgi:hypothetical protein
MDRVDFKNYKELKLHLDISRSRIEMMRCRYTAYIYAETNVSQKALQFQNFNFQTLWYCTSHSGCLIQAACIDCNVCCIYVALIIQCSDCNVEESTYHRYFSGTSRRFKNLF